VNNFSKTLDNCLAENGPWRENEFEWDLYRLPSEPVWQLRFPQLALSVEARKLIRFNKSENAKGMWKSIFASCHSGSEARPTLLSRRSL
jgi:hypothetical protein